MRFVLRVYEWFSRLMAEPERSRHLADLSSCVDLGQLEQKMRQSLQNGNDL